MVLYTLVYQSTNEFRFWIALGVSTTVLILLVSKWMLGRRSLQRETFLRLKTSYLETNERAHLTFGAITCNFEVLQVWQ